MKAPFFEWNLLSPIGTLKVGAAVLSKHCYLSTKLRGQQDAVLKLRWHTSNYRFLKWYMISDWERILGIQMSLSSLWFIVRLCPYLYVWSMKDDGWLIFDRPWKEEFMGMAGLRKKDIRPRCERGTFVYNDDNFPARVFKGLYPWMAPCLCCKVACWRDQSR